MRKCLPVDTVICHKSKNQSGTELLAPLTQLGQRLIFLIRSDVMFENLKYEISVVKENDPAAKSSLEIYFLYNGFKAVRAYRLAHKLHKKGHTFLARWISERAKRRTGIEIHPGATIGKGLFIDHGTGVVIGETAEIGDNCVIYQGVTLGGTGKDIGKRHPTLGNNVMVGAGAKILGPFRVGNNVKIAAGAVVLDAIPDNATAVGVPARVVKVDGKSVPREKLDQTHFADPVSQELCRLQARIDQLEKKLEEKKNETV